MTESSRMNMTLYSSSPNQRKKNTWMSNPWFRMYNEFASDPKVQSMSEVMQRRLVMLLCLRCANILSQLTVEELAYALSISEEELEKTSQVFQSKGFIDKTWKLMNWNKRQFISDTNSSSAERSRRYRARQKELKEEAGQVDETNEANEIEEVTTASRSHHKQSTQRSQHQSQSTEADADKETDKEPIKAASPKKQTRKKSQPVQLKAKPTATPKAKKRYTFVWKTWFKMASVSKPP